MDAGILGIGSTIVINDRYSRIDVFWLIYHVLKVYHGGCDPLGRVTRSAVDYVIYFVMGRITYTRMVFAAVASTHDRFVNNGAMQYGVFSMISGRRI